MPQLTYHECIKIQVLLDEAYSHRKISIKLGKGNSTISNEIKKYSIEGKGFTVQQADAVSVGHSR